MRIGIGVQALINHHGRGIEKYIQYFLKALAKIDSINEYVLLQEDTELEGNIFQGNFLPQSYHISARNYPRGLRWLWEYISLPREFKYFKLDLYHSMDLGIPRYGRGVYLATVHDILPYLYPQTCQISPQQLFKYRLKLWSLKRADHIIAISEYTKNDLVVKLGLSARRITVIPYGIADIFHPIDIRESRRVIKDKFKIEYPYILYVGAFGPTKNISVLLRSFRHVVDRFPNYRLVLIGSQKHPNYNQLIILSQNLGIEGKLTWIDSLEHKDLVSLYSAAHLFVFPSLLEGFGLPPLEAMACGAPVIASKAVSLPEVVGGAGILVDSRNVDDLSQSIIKVLSSDTMRLKMKVRGLKQAAQFSWGENARKTLGIYQKILENIKKDRYNAIN